MLMMFLSSDSLFTRPLLMFQLQTFNPVLFIFWFRSFFVIAGWYMFGGTWLFSIGIGSTDLGFPIVLEFGFLAGVQLGLVVLSCEEVVSLFAWFLWQPVFS